MKIVRVPEYEESDVLGLTDRPVPEAVCHECGPDDDADQNGASNIAKKEPGKDIAYQLFSLGAVRESALESSGAVRASAPVACEPASGLCLNEARRQALEHPQ